MKRWLSFFLIIVFVACSDSGTEPDPDIPFVGEWTRTITKTYEDSTETYSDYASGKAYMSDHGAELFINNQGWRVDGNTNYLYWESSVWVLDCGTLLIDVFEYTIYGNYLEIDGVSEPVQCRGPYPKYERFTTILEVSFNGTHD